MQRSVYIDFRRVVYEATGINLGPHKDALVAARIGKRMRALGIESHRDYLKRVVADESGDEMTQLVDAICTNVTSFFREEEHFTLVRSVVLSGMEHGQTRFRIWSAACSTGEEPYSLAMALRDVLAARPDVDLKILGTDLSTKALRIAQEGRYPASRVVGVHKDVLKRHFSRSGKSDATTYTVRPDVAAPVLFRQLNLSRPPFPMKGPLDVVMCRNVMIYFDKDVRERLLGEVYRLMRPGGLILVGHAESLSGVESGFKLVTPSVYARR